MRGTLERHDAEEDGDEPRKTEHREDIQRQQMAVQHRQVHGNQLCEKQAPSEQSIRVQEKRSLLVRERDGQVYLQRRLGQ